MSKQRVLSLLRGAEASRIRFTVPMRSGAVTINKTAFAVVANAIEAGKIKVKTQAGFAPGVGAEYDSGAAPGAPTGVLIVPPLRGREQEGLLMHECTHAFFDLKKLGVGATEEEAACYVVDALYFRMTGLTRARWSAEPHATAGAVAQGILRHYAVGSPGVPTVNVDAWRGLVLTVAMHPVYFSRTAGLPRWFFGTDAYTNDG
jgi:hypothetical protein